MRHRIGRRERRAFGRAVSVVQRQPRQRVLRAPQVHRRQRLAAGIERLQAAQCAGILVDHGIEQRCRQPRGGGAQRMDRLAQRGGIRHGSGQDHAGAAVEQRPPQFQRGRIETQWRGVQEACLFAERHVVDVHDEAQDRAMFDLHAFRRAGRTRGVHHVGEVILRRAVGWRVTGNVVGRHVARQAVRHQALQRSCMRRIRQGDAHAGIAEHLPQAFDRQLGVQREIGGARLQDRQCRDDGVGTARQADRDPLAAGEAQAEQSVGQCIGATIERGVIHLAADPCQRGARRMSCGTGAEQAMHGHGRARPSGVERPVGSRGGG